jgi:hypothetical protein
MSNSENRRLRRALSNARKAIMGLQRQNLILRHSLFDATIQVAEHEKVIANLKEQMGGMVELIDIGDMDWKESESSKGGMSNANETE